MLEVGGAVLVCDVLEAGAVAGVRRLRWSSGRRSGGREIRARP